MRETTNFAWTGGSDLSQRYARMIPGISAAPSPRASVKNVEAFDPPGAEGSAPRIRPRTFAQLLLPCPTADRWTLYQWVVADFLVLGMVYLCQLRLVPFWSFHPLALPMFASLVTLFAFTEGVYRKPPHALSAETVFGLGRSVLFATILVFFAAPRVANTFAIPATCASSLGALLFYRQLRQFAWARCKQNAACRRILLVGAGPVARSIAATLRNDPFHHAVVCGFVDDMAFSPGVLGGVADLDWLARGEFIDEVILAVPGQPEKARAAAAAALRNHLDIRAVPELPPGCWPDAAIDYIGEVPVVTLHREPLPTATLWLKRLVDLAGSAFCLALAAPLMGVIAVLIRLESPGPVFYSAERTGAKGRRFRCYKFRSMIVNADQLKSNLRSRNQREGPIFKIAGDPRITRVGGFIRRYSLDELPQLWNVFRGDMSLVGPRPHPVDEVNHYELHHYRRLDVKPGITGLWQITARQSPSFDLNMHLDLTYIENWSLRLDLRILFSTIRVLFAPEGA